MINLLFKVIKK